MGVCIIMDPDDNVATVLQKTASEDVLDVLDQWKNHLRSVTAIADIPFAHKICLKTVEKGGAIWKFGSVIGKATADIPIGGYAHVHNVVSVAGTPQKDN